MLRPWPMPTRPAKSPCFSGVSGVVAAACEGKQTPKKTRRPRIASRLPVGFIGPFVNRRSRRLRTCLREGDDVAADRRLAVPRTRPGRVDGDPVAGVDAFLELFGQRRNLPFVG